MRENERVTVVFAGSGKRYDANLGKMAGGEGRSLVLPCHLSDMGLELRSQLLDKVNIDAKTLRFNRRLRGTIERILIDGKPFVLVGKKAFYNRQTVLHVSEVMKRG